MRSRITRPTRTTFHVTASHVPAPHVTASPATTPDNARLTFRGFALRGFALRGLASRRLMLRGLTRRLLAAVSLTTLALTGCATTPESTGNNTTPEVPADDATISVVATTGYLADAVSNIAPDADVFTIVGPGGDPHTYQPSTKDIERILDADFVVWNGLHLEAQMSDLLRSRADRQLAAAEQLPTDMLLAWPETDDEGNPLHDPHVWNSPEAWQLVVGYVADALAEVNPERADEYHENATRHQQEIVQAALEAEELLKRVPEPRMLITGHDAFNYFGDTFDIEVHATDFISTDAALSAEELSELAELIAHHRVPVIFQDNQVNPQAITSLKEAVRALGWQVEIADDELYADSLGAEPGVDTMIGVFLHNARAISDALGTDETKP